MNSEARTGHPWRVPLLALSLLLVGASLFAQAYGTDTDFWGAVVFAAILLAFWGFIRSLQHGPAFERTARQLYRPEPAEARVRWALGWTYEFARTYSRAAIAIGGVLLVVLLVRNPGGWLRFLILLVATVVAYWLAATIAGVLLGLLKPLTRYALGAFAVGSLLGYTVYGTLMLMLVVVGGMGPMPWWLPAIPGVIGGGGLGLVEHSEVG